MNTMNKTILWIIGIVVIIVLVVGGYKLMKKHQATTMMYAPQTATVTPSMAPVMTNNTSGGLTNKTDTSNTQLDTDMVDVQNTMTKLNNDQVQSDQSLSNQSADTAPTQ